MRELDRILSMVGAILAIALALFAHWPDAKQDAIFVLLLAMYLRFRLDREDKKPE